MRANRKTPVQPSQRNRRKRHPKHAPGDHYVKDAYNRAICRAVEKANQKTTEEASKAGIDPRLLPRWSPNQLRHSTATEIRRQFGLAGPKGRCILSAADQHNLREVYSKFWRALDDIEEHLRQVHATAWPGDWWDGGRLGREFFPFLKEEIRSVLDARKRLHTLARKITAHVVAPPGETNAQWVVRTLAIGDEAYRLAKEEYGQCHFRYHGPMDPDLVVENLDDEEFRKQWKDKRRQVENDYQRVCCGLSEARQHLERVVSMVLPPTADIEEATASEEEQLGLPATSTEVRPSGNVSESSRAKKKGAWAHDGEPSAESRFSIGPLQGSLSDLARWMGRRPQWLRDRNGKSVWVQFIESRLYKVWFLAQNMYAEALKRKEAETLERQEEARKSAKGHERARTNKTSARTAEQRRPST